MAAVIAVVDDQLIALAQTGQGRQLSLGGGDVLGHDAVLLAYDDPVPAGTGPIEATSGTH